jgi:hypothetical protein
MSSAASTPVRSASPAEAMSACVRSRLAARGQQGGYILGMVLAAMAIGLTLITALLGLSFATQSAAIEQQRLARERRAADGALEVGVKKLRESADPSTLCNTSPWFETVPMQLSSNISAPDQDVGVSCTPELVASGAAGGLTVVGDIYGGNHTFDPPVVAGDATLLHQGGGPLRLAGNIAVRDGAMLNGSSLGARVAGSYRQGSPGAGAVSGCGELSPSDPSGSVARQLVDADDGEPVCQDATLAGLDVPPAPPVSRPDVAGLVPAVCGGPVGPGYFDPAAVQSLNNLLATCDRVLFPPGTAADPAVYWFDAGESGSVVFGNDGAEYLFGTEASFGDGVCDPSATERLTVVLGGGTGLSHTNGALTICGGEGNDFALIQSELADTQPRLELIGSTGWWTNPEKATGAWEDPAEVDWCRNSNSGGCSYPSLTYRIESSGVTNVEDLALEWKVQEHPPAIPVNRQVWVSIVGSSGSCDGLGGPAPGDVYEFRGLVADGMGLRAPLPNCDSRFATGADLDGATMTVQFRTWSGVPANGCGLGDSDCRWWANIADLGLSVNTTEIPPTSASSSDGSWDSPGNVVSPASDFTSAEWCDDHPFISNWCDRTGGVSNSTLSLGFADATSADDSPLSDAAIDRLQLALDTHDPVDQAAAPSSPGSPLTEVLLDWNDGSGATLCAAPATYSHTRTRKVSQGAVSGSQLLDLSDCVAGRTQADIQDLTVSLDFSPEYQAWLGDSLVNAGLQLPEFTYARLVVSAGSVDTSPNIRATVDESPAGGAAAKLFRVSGNSFVAGADLDVAWVGSGSSSAVPLFDGSLVVGSVGSRGDDGAAVGVLCCGDAHPTLLLTADIDPDDGVDVATGLARVRLEDDGAVVSAEVFDWQLCDAPGCPVGRIVSPGPSP